jgi:hypothetical protein
MIQAHRDPKCVGMSIPPDVLEGAWFDYGVSSLPVWKRTRATCAHEAAGVLENLLPSVHLRCSSDSVFDSPHGSSTAECEPRRCEYWAPLTGKMSSPIREPRQNTAQHKTESALDQKNHQLTSKVQLCFFFVHREHGPDPERCPTFEASQATRD